jgi:hypothetical protein
MTSFTFSLEQLRSAPLEVRHWIETEIAAALSGLNRLEHGPSEPHSAELAACTPEEALKVFELIKGNFLLSQVFFELAREMPNTGSSAPFHTLNLGELLRHTRLADGDRLADCFTAINKAFQNVRNDDEAALFGFDQYGRVYIHNTTHQSIRWVWQQLVAAHAPGPGGSVAAGHGGPPPFGFNLPHLGPSEDIAHHVPGPGTPVFNRQQLTD